MGTSPWPADSPVHGWGDTAPAVWRRLQSRGPPAWSKGGSRRVMASSRGSASYLMGDLGTSQPLSDLRPDPVPLRVQASCVASEGCLSDSQGPPSL